MGQEWMSQQEMKWKDQEEQREARAWEEWEALCTAEAMHEFREATRSAIRVEIVELREQAEFHKENEDFDMAELTLNKVESLEEQVEDEDLEIDESETVVEARARELFEATPAYYDWVEE